MFDRFTLGDEAKVDTPNQPKVFRRPMSDLNAIALGLKNP